MRAEIAPARALSYGARPQNRPIRPFLCDFYALTSIGPVGPDLHRDWCVAALKKERPGSSESCSSITMSGTKAMPMLAGHPAGKNTRISARSIDRIQQSSIQSIRPQAPHSEGYKVGRLHRIELGFEISAISTGFFIPGVQSAAEVQRFLYLPDNGALSSAAGWQRYLNLLFAHRQDPAIEHSSGRSSSPAF